MSQREDLTVAFTDPDAQGKVYFGAEEIPIVTLLEDMGLRRAGPTADQSPWFPGAWEDMPALEAFVILTNAQEDAEFRENPLFERTHAAKAGQV